MRYFIFTLILFVSTYSLAQNWAENNAIWHYEQINIQPPFNDDFIKFSSIGDTVILGKSAKVILEERINLSDTIVNELFMNSESNRVYLFDSFSNSFKLIYNFNALPGDTIEVFCPERFIDSTTTIVVDSVSTININGTILGVQHVSPLNFGGYYDLSGIIIENIGWSGFMFPLSTIADPPYGGDLRCFQNDSLGLYKPSIYDCDYITGIEPMINSNNFIVYPNPANELLHISIAKEMDLTSASVSLVDIFGKKVLTKQLSTDESAIDVSKLSNGIYILTVQTDKQTQVVRKITIGN